MNCRHAFLLCCTSTSFRVWRSGFVIRGPCCGRLGSEPLRVNSSFEDRPEGRITLRHLLSHTAGFTHEAPVGSNYLVGRKSFQAHCDSISDTWLRFPVGRHHQSSNLGIRPRAVAGAGPDGCRRRSVHERQRRMRLSAVPSHRWRVLDRSRAPRRDVRGATQ
ncbi:hypothetical protein E0H75_30745 [Kribbella capetownensis]|uniref:Beta-lactamase-related domain-containing protein n=1 Tax=Kribbella capetownensis TaxID=1572659 RepID=A0A4R0JKF8_9ACTN|nr:hypothetical protein E0H75_30745 [Kribbella capetownensis]